MFDVKKLFFLLSKIFSSRSVAKEPWSRLFLIFKAFKLEWEKSWKNLKNPLPTMMMMMIFLLSRDYKLSWTLMTSFSGFSREHFASYPRSVLCGWKRKELKLVFASTKSFTEKFIFLLLVFLLKWFIVFITHPIKKQFISIYLSTVLLSRTQSWWLS